MCEGTDNEQLFCSEPIRKGSCFIAYKIGEELRFAPSRYIGYSKNTMQLHKQCEKDGKETNPAITKLFGKLAKNENLDTIYIDYCNSLGTTPHNKKRKFWLLSIEGFDFKNNERTDEGFPKGKIVERKHTVRERNSALIAQAKEQFKTKNSRLFCEACNFDFEKTYRARGLNFIEAHHISLLARCCHLKKLKSQI
ncbi:HNH endonuclease [Iodobacter violaceini]|uniref:HNH endonuclease n=1 Tax=Iodobacter violaceini TaxID=3044271 RepID=UPI00197C7442|nr:hypothetical protein [Iodobacter violacea]